MASTISCGSKSVARIRSGLRTGWLNLPGCAWRTYRRNVDVDLDGMIDGIDMTWAAMRFGEFLGKTPLVASLSSDPPAPDTVSFQQGAHEGDLLRVQVVVDDDNEGVALATFVVVFDADVLEFVRSAKGTALRASMVSGCNRIRFQVLDLLIQMSSLPASRLIRSHSTLSVSVILQP